MNDTHSRIKREYTALRINEVECPNCRGQGVTRGPQINMPWSDCQWCKGTGVLPEEDALAHGGEP